MTDEDYMGVPTSILTEIGRLVVAGTRLEDVIYHVGESALNIARIRGRSAGEAADAIRDEVRQHGVPPWSQGRTTSGQVDTWASSTKQALDRRHEVIHGVHYRQYDGQAWVGHDRRTGGKTPGRVTELSKLVSARRALEKAVHETFGLWQTLSPVVREGRWMILFGPYSGGLLADGDTPEGRDPTDSERTEWWERFIAEHGGAPGTTPTQGPTVA